MIKTELAYLAGFIDGEGTISLHKAAYKGQFGFYAYPFLQVANSHDEVIAWIMEKAPAGNHYRYDRHPDKCKPANLIQWRGSHAVDQVRDLVPYLIVKKEHALILLDYWEGRGKWNGSKRGHWCRNNPMPLEVVAFRERAYNQLRNLNRKGPVH